MKTRTILPGFIISVFALALLAAPQRSVNSAAPAAPVVAPSTVTISNFQFTPKMLTVKAGTTVTWVNKEGTHTVTSDTGAFSSDNLTVGKSFSYTFAKPGTHRYYCSFHGSRGGGDMSGVVRVTR